MADLPRSQISFEQAEGVQPLPQQMALGTLSRPLRALLCDATLNSIKADMAADGRRVSLGPGWESTFRRYFLERGVFPNKISVEFKYVSSVLSEIFDKSTYAAILGMVEFFARNLASAKVRVSYVNAVSAHLERQACAYRLIDGSILPIASPEEGQAIYQAMDSLAARGLSGARGHLLRAGSALTAAEYADSIRESIHAVESTARALTGKGSLREALNEIAAIHPMHPALKEGLNRIYGYTNDANGIRHPIVSEDGPQAGEDEALFMFGACASFITYLARIGPKPATQPL